MRPQGSESEINSSETDLECKSIKDWEKGNALKRRMRLRGSFLDVEKVLCLAVGLDIIL